LAAGNARVKIEHGQMGFTLRELEQRVGTVDPAVLLVSPRTLRRVIRLDRRFGAFDFGVPHRKSYAIAGSRLFEHVSRFELELDEARELPETVLLLERPEDDEFNTRPAAEILSDCWRLLFHIRVHVELERRIKAGTLTEDDLLDRLHRIGAPEFAEARTVLQREEMLLPPVTDLSSYVEFAAVFLELSYFAPEQLAWYFPALEDHASIATVLAVDLDHAALHEATRLPGAHDRATNGHEGMELVESPPAEPAAADPLLPSPPAYWRLIARAERVGSLGNTVKAAILRCKASRLALPDRVQETKSRARAELGRLARRLQTVLGLTDEETREWSGALEPVLERADQAFRSLEARLLYDLQKVCVEHERGLYTVDPVEWCRTLGRVAVRRPLPLLREVKVAKHLQHAARKLRKSRLTGEARQRLSRLIEGAVQRAQQQLRDRVRPMVAEVLTAEGLRPQNVPEQVAFHKVVEELLDRVVDRGYLSLGHLRDAFSQNNLKLPDLTSLWQLLTGDLLLRVDSRLSVALDGVYHRGPIYLRWSQRLSAMAFGTPFGRFLTRFLALPFGGAFLLIEFLRHIAELLGKQDPHALPESQIAEQLASDSPVARISAVSPSLQTIGAVVLLGIFLLLLLEHARFRRWCLDRLWDAARTLRRVVYDLPVAVLRLSWVRRFLDSPFYAGIVGYGVKPLLFTAALLLPFELAYGRVTWGATTITFLAVNLFLNSPLGRYLDQVITDELARSWREVQIRVLAAGLRMIIDAFQWLMQAIEQVVYTVDEWMLFRTGDSRRVLAAKAVLSVVWSVIAYGVRFCVTLLIEPQVNPLKHFPVVTVSHKMLIPAGPLFVKELAPYLGLARANTVVWSTIWLIPGVFGFLVWELKENWRLYAANRPKHLKPVPIGSHGETLLRLLRLGFHSGTVPRRFGRLRRAGRVAARTGKRKAVHEHLEKLRHVEQKLRNFVERELLALLALCPAWKGQMLEVGRIRLATNSVRIEVRRGDQGTGDGDRVSERRGHVDQPLVLVFQQQAGWVIASMPLRGWLDAASREERQAFLNAIRGLYKYGGVALIWERLSERLGAELVWHEVRSDGLLLWRDRRYHFAELYRLRDTSSSPQTANPVRFVTQPKESELDEVLLSRQPLAWETWVAMWMDC
jgi:hypothetical protein